ncbi:MAG TPA: hypothetical protein VML96_09085 [Egibacteraceae bacterium]|nr:hypothetical protein [Egibacteraceae bacterium]
MLIWTSSIDAIRNVDREIHVDFHCTCGWEATLVTGRGVQERLIEDPDRVGGERVPALTGPLAS